MPVVKTTTTTTQKQVSGGVEGVNLRPTQGLAKLIVPGDK